MDKPVNYAQEKDVTVDKTTVPDRNLGPKKDRSYVQLHRNYIMIWCYLTATTTTRKHVQLVTLCSNTQSADLYQLDDVTP